MRGDGLVGAAVSAHYINLCFFRHAPFSAVARFRRRQRTVIVGRLALCWKRGIAHPDPLFRCVADKNGSEKNGSRSTFSAQEVSLGPLSSVLP